MYSRFQVYVGRDKHRDRQRATGHSENNYASHGMQAMLVIACSGQTPQVTCLNSTYLSVPGTISPEMQSGRLLESVLPRPPKCHRNHLVIVRRKNADYGRRHQANGT